MERNARSTRSWNKSNDFTTTSVASFSSVEAVKGDILLLERVFVVGKLHQFVEENSSLFNA